MIDFAAFKKLMVNLHFPDQNILRHSNLGKLAGAYNSYPTQHEGHKFCILLPKGLFPKEASKLSEEEAIERNIVILRGTGSSWSKVWPTEKKKAAE